MMWIRNIIKSLKGEPIQMEFSPPYFYSGLYDEENKSKEPFHTRFGPNRSQSPSILMCEKYNFGMTSAGGKLINLQCHTCNDVNYAPTKGLCGHLGPHLAEILRTLDLTI